MAANMILAVQNPFVLKLWLQWMLYSTSAKLGIDHQEGTCMRIPHTKFGPSLLNTVAVHQKQKNRLTHRQTQGIQHVPK